MLRDRNDARNEAEDEPISGCARSLPDRTSRELMA